MARLGEARALLNYPGQAQDAEMISDAAGSRWTISPSRLAVAYVSRRSDAMFIETCPGQGPISMSRDTVIFMAASDKYGGPRVDDS